MTALDLYVNSFLDELRGIERTIGTHRNPAGEIEWAEKLVAQLPANRRDGGQEIVDRIKEKMK